MKLGPPTKKILESGPPKLGPKLGARRRVVQLHDLRYVTKVCADTVQRARDPTGDEPSVLVAVPPSFLYGRDIKEASETCGMALTLEVPLPAMAAQPSSGGEAKY